MGAADKDEGAGAEMAAGEVELAAVVLENGESAEGGEADPAGGL